MQNQMKFTVNWTGYLSFAAYQEQAPYTAGQFPMETRNHLAAIGLAALDAVQEAELAGMSDADEAFLVVTVKDEGATKPFTRFGVPYGPLGENAILAVKMA